MTYEGLEKAIAGCRGAIMHLAGVADDLKERVSALEEPTVNDDQIDSTPDPGVVGYMDSDCIHFLRVNASNKATVYREPEWTADTPVILQSDHEAVVRGLRERLERTEARRHVAEGCIHKLQLAHHEEVERLREERDRLKAENERLRESLEESRRMYRNRDGRLLEANAEVRRLKRERDAYADPGNWHVTKANGQAIGIETALHFLRPTPSDTEAESVEGGCPDGLLPDGDTCPRCGGPRAASGIDGGTWVHHSGEASGG